MRVKVFRRTDGATVVLPLDLWGSLPMEFEGALEEVGDAELDMACLSPPLVTALGLTGYCIAIDGDVDTVLSCITRWKAPFILESATRAEANVPPLEEARQLPTSADTTGDPNAQ